VKRIDNIAALREALAAARTGGAAIGFVPTMGYLHEGHLSLCDEARATCDVVVLSIFVNPLQFGVGEDLDRYPRDLERDAAMATGRGVDILFTPSVEEMYPHGAGIVRVTAPALTDRLCGAFRPGHFDGVLTVVAKLLGIVAPDVAVFGQKDLQQAVLVRRMAEELNMPVRIHVAPVIREPDGLAMSSRNVYLGPSERQAARALYRALQAAQAAFSSGEADAGRLASAALEILEGESGVAVQYVEVVETSGLARPARVRAGDAVAIAAFAGATRLIDNHVLDGAGSRS
jgi:pantoate--beta-alanine ligase